MNSSEKPTITSEDARLVYKSYDYWDHPEFDIRLLSFEGLRQ